MREFIYQASPMRVVFGAGQVNCLPDELGRLGISRALVLSTSQQHEQAERIVQLIGARAAGVFAGAITHTPVTVTDRAMDTVRGLDADGIVAVGGGATTGLSKAIALRTDLPQVILPTTYAGSEMTPILGETRDGIKTTQSSTKVLPETVIYDVELTLSMSPRFSALSGLNAVAHAVEALYARDNNPIISMIAREAISKLAVALPRVSARPSDLNCRQDALYGAWLCGICLGTVGMALHHKLCHTVGALFDLPHAETHAVLLPHTVAYNTSAAPDAMGSVAKAIGASDAAEGLFDLAKKLDAPLSLAEIGMPAVGITRAARLAIENPYWNPRPVEQQGIRDLLVQAWSGRRPQQP